MTSFSVRFGVWESFRPRLIYAEKDGSVIIETDMPGFDKNDISGGVERRIPYGERETRRKQGKRRKGTLYTQREEKRQLFEELLTYGSGVKRRIFPRRMKTELSR